jgi:hypothetical protein
MPSLPFLLLVLLVLSPPPLLVPSKTDQTAATTQTDWKKRAPAAPWRAPTDAMMDGATTVAPQLSAPQRMAIAPPTARRRHQHQHVQQHQLQQHDQHHTNRPADQQTNTKSGTSTSTSASTSTNTITTYTAHISTWTKKVLNLERHRGVTSKRVVKA